MCVHGILRGDNKIIKSENSTQYEPSQSKRRKGHLINESVEWWKKYEIKSNFIAPLSSLSFLRMVNIKDFPAWNCTSTQIKVFFFAKYVMKRNNKKSKKGEETLKLALNIISSMIMLRFIFSFSSTTMNEETYTWKYGSWHFSLSLFSFSSLCDGEIGDVN